MSLVSDTHGNFSRFKDVPKDEEYNVIILGDAGINYSLDEQDNQLKNRLKRRYCNLTFYVVRGNHEARPQSIKTMKTIYDPEVQGIVYMEDKWPNIRYFMDYGIYTIDNLAIGVIGGAYSVDKWFRLSHIPRIDGWTGWFFDEELSDDEMAAAYELFKNQKFDLILSHTCPDEYKPVDLFLSFVDQASISDRMEKFLSLIAKNCSWKKWCYGHYHDDRNTEKTRMFYNDIVSLEDINNELNYSI